FGARGRIGRGSIGRTVVLAAALAVLPSLPRTEPSTRAWLGIGLAAALGGVGGLGGVGLSLAREVGVLRGAGSPGRARAGPVPDEGAELGARSSLLGELEPGRIGLAVFTSEGCGICRVLEPTIASFGEHPAVQLRIFDEYRDRDAWAAADVPGSPFAVALDAD